MDKQKQLSPRDACVVVSKVQPTVNYHDVLTCLYQPIIGSDALSLYLTFDSWKQSGMLMDMNRHMHKDIYTTTGLGERKFYDARIKLEAVHLLKTFIVQTKNEIMYIYEILPPLNGNDFFNEPLLANLLLDDVGETSWKNLRDRFILEIPYLTDARDITQSFLDVFNVNLKGKDTHSIITQNVKHKMPEINFPEAFDVDYFTTLLRQRSYLDINSVMENLDEINTLTVLYGLDEIQLVELLQRSADLTTNQVNISKLRFLTSKEFEMVTKDTISPAKQEESKPTIVSAMEPKQDTYRDNLIKTAKYYAPLFYLEYIKQALGGFVDKSEVSTLEKVIKTGQLPNEVINVLINYMLVVLQMPNLQQRYFNTVSNDWMRKKVTTAEQAVDLLEQRDKSVVEKVNKQPANKYNNSKVIKKEKLPKWAQAGWKPKQSTQKELQEDEEIKRQALADLDEYLDGKK